MKTTTHNGCKIKVRAGRGSEWGRVHATINGGTAPVSVMFDENKAIDELKRFLDFVHSSPVDGDRWQAHYYAQGTYEICSEGHPREIDGECTHSYCAAQT